MVCTIGHPCSLAHSRTRRLSEGVRLTVSHSLFVSYSAFISVIRASVALCERWRNVLGSDCRALTRSLGDMSINLPYRMTLTKKGFKFVGVVFVRMTEEVSLSFRVDFQNSVYPIQEFDFGELLDPSGNGRNTTVVGNVETRKEPITSFVLHKLESKPVPYRVIDPRRNAFLPRFIDRRATSPRAQRLPGSWRYVVLGCIICSHPVLQDVNAGFARATLPGTVP